MEKNLIIFVALLFISCQENNSKEHLQESFASTYEMESIEKEKVFNSVEEKSSQQSQRKLIYNAILNFQVDDLSKAEESVLEITKNLGGYVQSQGSSPYNITIEVFIPSQNFHQFIENIKNSVKNTINVNIKTKDVTAEFIDLEIRIKNKQNLEQTYTDLLKKSKTISEVLEIQDAINKTRTEIEQMQGSLNFLKHHTTFSKITCNIRPNIQKNIYKESFFTEFSHSFKEGFEGLKTFILILTQWWAAFAIGGIGYLVWKRFRKNKKS